MPVRVTEVHQVEVTTRCQLSCNYCIHPLMRRPKRDMNEQVWADTLRWLRYFMARGTQGELVLMGTGEPTLHPRLVEMCTEARQVLGPDRRILSTTNGLAMTEALVRALRPLNVRWYVSAHRLDRAADAIHILSDYGMLEGISIDAATFPHDWAGQVRWRTQPQHVPDAPACPFLQAGWGFVDVEGHLRSCCFVDDQEDTYLGHVRDAPSAEVENRAHGLCPTCFQTVPTLAEQGHQPDIRR